MKSFSSGTDSEVHSMQIKDSNQPSVESERCSDIEWIRTFYIAYQSSVVSKFGESAPPFVKISSDLKNIAAFVSTHTEYAHAILPEGRITAFKSRRALSKFTSGKLISLFRTLTHGRLFCTNF